MTKMNYNCIKGLLANAGKTNLELAEYLGVHENTISSWCTNRNQPDFESLFKVAQFLGTEAGNLLTLAKDLRPIKGKPIEAKRTVSKKGISKK